MPGSVVPLAMFFSKIVSQCFDKSFKLDPCCLAPHNDRLLPTDYQALQHNWDLTQAGKIWQVVDVQLDVNEAVPRLRHIVVSLLCTLLNIEEEAASCLLGVIEVDVQTRNGDVGEV